MNPCPRDTLTTKATKIQVCLTNSPTTNDLRDELAARKESEAWNLKPCPCCGAEPHVLELRGVKIACSRYGCRIVDANTIADAAALWNAVDFRGQRHD